MENKYQEAIDYLYENCSVNVFEEYGDPEEDTCVNKTPDDQLAVLQELLDNYQDCKNELCLKCGNYKESHLGKCDGCRWYK